MSETGKEEVVCVQTKPSSLKLKKILRFASLSFLSLFLGMGSGYYLQLWQTSQSAPEPQIDLGEKLFKRYGKERTVKAGSIKI